MEVVNPDRIGNRRGICFSCASIHVFCVLPAWYRIYCEALLGRLAPSSTFEVEIHASLNPFPPVRLRQPTQSWQSVQFVTILTSIAIRTIGAIATITAVGAIRAIPITIASYVYAIRVARSRGTSAIRSSLPSVEGP